MATTVLGHALNLAAFYCYGLALGVTLTPMALGIGRGADLRAPLAIAVIGGLAVATLLTLVVVPVLYATFFKKRSVCRT